MIAPRTNRGAPNHANAATERPAAKEEEHRQVAATEPVGEYAAEHSGRETDYIHQGDVETGLDRREPTFRAEERRPPDENRIGGVIRGKVDH